MHFKKKGSLLRNFLIVILLFDAPPGCDRVYDVMIGGAGLHYPECNALSELCVYISVDGFFRLVL